MGPQQSLPLSKWLPETRRSELPEARGSCRCKADFSRLQHRGELRRCQDVLFRLRGTFASVSRLSPSGRRACPEERARHEAANPGRPSRHAASRENACISSPFGGHTAGFNRTLFTRSVIVSSACAATNVAEDGWAAELRRFSCAVRCLHTVASKIRAPRQISMTWDSL
jgi:hypothetical protein